MDAAPTPQPAAFVGDHVRVDESDHVDDALVVTIAAPFDDPSIGRLAFEVSRAEARELIQGLVALL